METSVQCSVADQGFGKRSGPKELSMLHSFISCLINQIYNTLKEWKIYKIYICNIYNLKS